MVAASEASFFIGIITKIISGVVAVASPFIYVWVKNVNSKLSGMYSKEETTDLIDLKLKPIEEKVDRSAEVQTQILSTLNGIDTKVAVVQNDISHIKEDVAR